VPTSTSTPIPGAPPESSGDVIDDSADPDGSDISGEPTLAYDSGNGLGDEEGAGVSPDGEELGADGLPVSGYGPQEHPGNSADMIALVAFVVAVVMLGAGFTMQARVRRNDK
jgi:hypothetical protein